MKIKTNNRTRIAAAVTLALLTAGGFFYASKSFSSGTPPDLDYFKGNWVVTLRSSPQATFHWTVKDDLNGGWMVGVVERNGEKVSTDFWRRNGNKIERFAFTADGTFVRIEGQGWQSNRLVLAGVASGTSGETPIRETISRVSDREFQALWERNVGGKWIVFSDEICTRQQPPAN